jgi:hypothetical protein
LYRDNPSLFSSSFESGEGAGPPVTLYVCRESREFTMGLFTQSHVYERWRSWAAESWGWRKVWMHRDDTLYFAWREWKYLREGKARTLPKGTFDRSLSQKVIFAMKLRQPKRDAWMRLEGEDAPTSEQTLHTAEVDLEEQLLKILRFWDDGVGLKELSLAIDGRFRFYHGETENRQPEEFVEPTFEDQFVDGGREQLLQAFDRVVQRIRAGHPDLDVPKCAVKLFVNGKRKNRKIFWDYHHGRANDEYVWDESG